MRTLNTLSRRQLDLFISKTLRFTLDLLKDLVRCIIGHTLALDERLLLMTKKNRIYGEDKHVVKGKFISMRRTLLPNGWVP
jgi:hypothetical protein